MPVSNLPRVSDEKPTVDPDETEDNLEKSSSGTVVPEEHRRRRVTFFQRAGTEGNPLEGLQVEAGGRWSEAEADRKIREFLIRLAGDRKLIHHADPVELARDNDLLLLFGPEQEEIFAALAVRFPDETLATWTLLLSGGDSAESFGPRSRAERRDEAAISKSIKVAFRRRVLGMAATVVLLITGGLFVRTLFEEGIVDRSEQALWLTGSGSSPDDQDGQEELALGLPIALPELVASLNTVVAVVAGEGSVEERVRTEVPEGLLSHAPGEISATIFRHRGGQVALVGPSGWMDEACVRVSVVDNRLRPFDVVTYETAPGVCPDNLPGRLATVACQGDTVLILSLGIPQGEVSLVEGGTSWPEAVRVGLESHHENWETLALRGTISVDTEQGDVVVPSYHGEKGDTILVRLGAGGFGECLLL